MLIRMTSALFRGARMNDVLIPTLGETVELDDESAETLIRAGHAEEASEPETAENAEIRIVEPNEKRTAGRSPKAKG